MAFASNHLVITFGGAIAITEDWSTRLLARSTTPMSDDALIVVATDDFATTLYENALDFPGNPGISNMATFDYVKVAAVGADGHYIGDVAPGIHAVGRGTGPAGGGGKSPSEVAYVMTWTTVAVRGHASKGRSYLPWGALADLATDGRVPAASAAAMADRAAVWIQHVNTELQAQPGGSDLECAVMSQIGGGVSHAINGVKVGRVPDVQRRRRRSLVEDYQATRVAGTLP